MAKRKAAQPAEQPGIQELIWVDPKTLDDNPHNWRKHPARQMRALQASIKANGWADALKWNKNTGRLIDGHGRKQVAISAGEPAVPVLVGWWTEEQERNLLATMDPLAAMAETDAGALQSLLDLDRQTVSQASHLEAEARKALSDLNESLDSYAWDVHTGKQKKSLIHNREVAEEEEALPREQILREDTGVRAEVDASAVFKSSNVWGLPDLLPNMLYDGEPLKVWDRSKEFDVTDPDAWYCQSARPFPPDREGGLLGFYTDDHRFERCWGDAEAFANQLLDEEWTAVATPTYSVWWDWPLAVRLYNAYRGRWCVRLWQSLEIPIIPGVIWDNTDYSFEWGIRTLPKNCPVVSVQCRGINRHGSFWKRFQEGLEETVSYLTPGKVIVYGGGSQDNSRKMRRLPAGTEYVLLDSYMGARRAQMGNK